MVAPSPSLLASLVGGSLLAFACALPEPTPEGENKDLIAQQDQQSQRLAAAFCEVYYGCGCEPPVDSSHTDQRECTQEVGTLVARRLKQGRDQELDYDPACIEAHTELYEAMECQTTAELLVESELLVLLDAADRCRTYHGTQGLQEDCETLVTARGDDCEPALSCHPDFQLCIDQRPRQEGESCADSTVDCAVGLVCAEDQWRQLSCQRLAVEGEPCESEHSCARGLYCDLERLVCTPLPGLGEPCVASWDRESCALDLRCDAGVCSSTAGPGESCDLGCGPTTVCIDGTCEPEPAVICGRESTLP